MLKKAFAILSGLILTCGVYADTIRLLPPLSAPEKILKEGLDILEAAITYGLGVALAGHYPIG